MAARRGKSQARRSTGNSGSLPGWAWMIIGVVLALGVVLAVPRLLKPDAQDGFFRPSPNPDAQPAASTGEDEPELPTPAGQRPRATAQTSASPDYDFYTMLPEQEVPMTDAELAASARAETERQRRAEAQQQALQARHPDAADLAGGAATSPQPQPLPEAPATARAQPPAPATPATAAATPAPAGDSDARYILQAGSFSASGDAEALKARIALLGLSARVESGQAAGRTVYRVRMGPYGTATDLAEAKQKLGNGGLPALAIKAQ
ncbi:SPOR domain-containing protein [Luteimonas sp. 100069]|uniref:SPOR domain-containing protein n=1 Tax=Luteimonas sp. 100069 TaxID=2006109 RepID=UPI000F5070CB|nr:SPOR domain-containing protein [Luteimonas sp. 100069]RPD85222.1 sporulation protein [Luteimonas sp. 100069]